MRFFLALLLIIPALALANDPEMTDMELSWDIPTERTDGTPLAPEEIDGYAIDYSYNNGTQQTIIIDGGLTIEHLMPDVLAGSYIFEIATISNEQVGPSSNPVTVTLDEIRKAEVAPPVIRVQLSCENCNLEVR